MEEQISNQQAFAEKVVWITGASGGIGEEMAVEFARAGSKLVPVSYTHLTLPTILLV